MIVPSAHEENLSLRLTFLALAASRLNVVIEIFFTVVESNFFTGFYILLRPYPDTVTGNKCLSVWTA